MRFLYYVALFIAIYYLLKFLFRYLLLWFGHRLKKRFEEQFNIPTQEQNKDDDDEFTEYEEVE